jgi:UDP-galactopyranose mutase
MGVDPSKLDKSVTARVPTRTSRDSRYFEDEFQVMPAAGYTVMFERMLDHPNITLKLGTDFTEVQGQIPYERLIFTGPVDEYFGYRYGRLPYRSLRFEHVTLEKEWHQPVAVVNYPGTHDYTRITEYKHLTGQVHPSTSLTYEYRWRSVLSYPAARKCRSLSKIRAAGAGDGGGLVRGALGDL